MGQNEEERSGLCSEKGERCLSVFTGFRRKVYGMSKKVTISVSEKRCKQCGICSALCPRQVFTQEVGQVPVVAHLDQCIACRLCEMRCPDFAIDVEVE